jgi:hypothetical protein
MDGMMAEVMKGGPLRFLLLLATGGLGRSPGGNAYSIQVERHLMQYVQTKDFSCEYQVFRLDAMYAPPRKLWCSIGMIRTSPQSTRTMEILISMNAR